MSNSRTVDIILIAISPLYRVSPREHEAWVLKDVPVCHQEPLYRSLRRECHSIYLRL